MHRPGVVLTLIQLVASAAAQAQTTRQDTRGAGQFGAPVVAYSVFRGQGALMFGGQGGWNITPSLLVGGAAYATMTEINGPDDPIATRNGPVDLKVETFGFDVAYAPRPAESTHLTLSLFAGGGAAHYMKDGTREQQDETDFMFVVEPSVGVEKRISNGVRLRGAVSYRLVSGVEQPGLSVSDVNGPSVSLALKFGRF